MIHIRLISADQSVQDLHAAPGQSLMRATTEAGIQGVEGDCGGTLTCASCHVMVDPAWAHLLPPPVPDEIDMLDFAACPAQPHSRLSCQIQLSPALDGLVVYLPAAQH